MPLNPTKERIAIIPAQQVVTQFRLVTPNRVNDPFHPVMVTSIGSNSAGTSDKNSLCIGAEKCGVALKVAHGIQHDNNIRPDVIITSKGNVLVEVSMGFSFSNG